MATLEATAETTPSATVATLKAAPLLGELDICVRAVRYHHRLCNGQTARRANLDGGHGEYGSVAATPSSRCVGRHAARI
jgi:hypothetical protein